MTGMAWHGVIEQYRKFLPVTEKTPVISLHEGGTPLIRATTSKPTSAATLRFG